MSTGKLEKIILEEIDAILQEKQILFPKSNNLLTEGPVGKLFSKLFGKTVEKVVNKRLIQRKPVADVDSVKYFKDNIYPPSRPAAANPDKGLSPQEYVWAFRNADEAGVAGSGLESTMWKVDDDFIKYTKDIPGSIPGNPAWAVAADGARKVASKFEKLVEKEIDFATDRIIRGLGKEGSVNTQAIRNSYINLLEDLQDAPRHWDQLGKSNKAMIKFVKSVRDLPKGDEMVTKAGISYMRSNSLRSELERLTNLLRKEEDLLKSVKLDVEAGRASQKALDNIQRNVFKLQKSVSDTNKKIKFLDSANSESNRYNFAFQVMVKEQANRNIKAIDKFALAELKGFQKQIDSAVKNKTPQKLARIRAAIDTVQEASKNITGVGQANQRWLKLAGIAFKDGISKAKQAAIKKALRSIGIGEFKSFRQRIIRAGLTTVSLSLAIWFFADWGDGGASEEELKELEKVIKKDSLHVDFPKAKPAAAQTAINQDTPEASVIFSQSANRALYMFQSEDKYKKARELIGKELKVEDWSFGIDIRGNKQKINLPPKMIEMAKEVAKKSENNVIPAKDVFPLLRRYGKYLDDPDAKSP